MPTIRIIEIAEIVKKMGAYGLENDTNNWWLHIRIYSFATLSFSKPEKKLCRKAEWKFEISCTL